MDERTASQQVLNMATHPPVTTAGTLPAPTIPSRSHIFILLALLEDSVQVNGRVFADELYESVKGRVK